MKAQIYLRKKILNNFLIILLISALFIPLASTKPDHRTQTSIEYDYTGIVMAEKTSKVVKFRVENKASDSKDLLTYLSGANASFEETQETKVGYQLEGGSEKKFQIRLEPESLGDKRLVITTENQKLGFNNTASIPITVKNYQDVTSTSEVSGLGMIQLLTLLLVSAYLYSVRL